MILLLTGCINPDGMAFTSLNNCKEREKQYVDAIQFYLSNTYYKIVFTENSGTDISFYFQDSIKSGRLEYLCFHGNQNKVRGKGYGECEIIQYAICHSTLINCACDKRIAKITGRLKVKNIKTIINIHTILFSKHTTLCAINSDLSFPDSRFIIAHIDFYQAFLKKKEEIDDSIGYYFEHALCDTIKTEKRFPFSPFFLMPYIEGMSGTKGEEYIEIKNTFSYTTKYARYAYSQRKKFNAEYR